MYLFSNTLYKIIELIVQVLLGVLVNTCIVSITNKFCNVFKIERYTTNMKQLGERLDELEKQLEHIEKNIDAEDK